MVQLYVHEVKPSVPRPTKELRGFRRIHLRPGETQKVEITVPAEKLAFYDESQHSFRVKPGPFQILIGASSEDIRARAGFAVESRQQ